MLHAILHVLGIDTQQSYFYDFWSGIATQATVVAAAFGAYFKHNCHEPRCLRIAKHQVEGTPWCTKHRTAAPQGEDR